MHRRAPRIDYVEQRCSAMTLYIIVNLDIEMSNLYMVSSEINPLVVFAVRSLFYEASSLSNPG